MSSTAWKTHKKACARYLKNASHSGRIGKRARRLPAARPIPMDDPENIPGAVPPEVAPETGAALDQIVAAESAAELGFVHEPARISPPPAMTHEDVESRRRSFRRNL